jgi:zinc protease
VLSSDFALGLDLLSDVLLQPAFPAEALERERQVQLAGIRAQKDHLLQSAAQAMRRTLFGPTGYGLDALGKEESVQNIQVADLKTFHNRLARPNNCVLAIYGDVDPAAVRAAVEKAFGNWQPNPELATGLVTPSPHTVHSVQRITETRDKKQAVLVIGYRGTTLQDPDRYALELVQEACSDLGSRLFLRIRDELGLAYYVGAQNFIGLVPGYFAFYVGTSPEQVALAEAELLHQAELLRRDGLTPEELKRAQTKIIGQRKIARQDLGGLAMTTALDELYGLGYANSDTEDGRYEAVTLEQVKGVTQKYLKPDALVLAVVRPDAPPPN